MSLEPIVTDRLILRNWREADRPLFHHINSDPAVMEFFPFRRDRAQADELMDRLARMIDDTGFGFLAIELRGNGKCAGFAGLAKINIPAAFPPDKVEIGWRLAPEFWGHGYATEAATALVEHGFAHHGLAEIVSYAAPANTRSIAIMQRLGMHRDATRDFDLPSVPDEMAWLRPHVVYALSAEDWDGRKK